MAATQERRTRMIASSINAPMKKEGGGGSYTWGTAMDVKDFEPVGLPTGSVGVVTAPAPIAITASTSPAYQFEPYNQLSFPTLGATIPVSAPVQWGPSPSTTTTQVLNESSLRTGAIDVVGAQHPRNMFAKKPYTAQRSQAVQVATQAQEGMIDWTKSGIPQGVVQSIVQSNAAAAHLGPYATQATQVPLQTLRVQSAAQSAGYQQFTPAVAKPVVKSARTISGGIKQPGGKM